MLTSVKNKLRRLLAMVISALLVISVVVPVEAKAQESPYDPITHLDEAYAYGYGGLLDLRLLHKFLTIGKDGRALTAAELRGVDQLWKTAVNNDQAAKTSNIDLGALELIYLNLGAISLPLVGEGGLLELVLNDASVGVLREYAHTPSATAAHGAAGVVSDSGGLEITQPGSGKNASINLLSLLNLRGSTLITEDIISAAALELGAVSAVATKPDTSALDENASVTCDPNLTLLDYNALKSRQIHSGDLSGDDEVLQEEDGRICSGYQVADAQVVVDAPGVGTLVSTLTTLLGGVESTLNVLLEGGGLLERLQELELPLLGAVLSLLGKVEAKVHLPVTEITDALIVDPLEDSTRLVSIDLSTGQISVDLKQLHAGNLNGLEPNSSLLTPAELAQITDAVTNLLTASKKEEPKGLNARLDKLLRGEEEQGGLYATEVKIDVCVLPLFGPCLVDTTISATLGGLLNPTVLEANTIAQYEAEPYKYYYVEGLLTLVPNRVIRLLGGIGTVVEGLLFGEGTGLLGGLLGDLQTQVVSPLLTTLTPVLEGVLDPIANIIINRQTLQEVEHGTVFTVSALEVNVLELGTQGELLHLPLATASVMAQPPVTMDFDVAKVGDGRNLYTDDYTYDLVCTLGEGENEREVVNKTGPEESIVYAATKVGDGFVYGQADPDEPPKLSLTGATGGLTEPIRISPGAQCTVTGTAPTLTTADPALRPTGTGDGARTPYTYFLDVDATTGVLISGSTPTDGLTALNPIPMTSSGSVSPNTDNVGNEWKNHSFTFTVPAGKDIHRVSIVHAYDIDTRVITLSKTTTGPAPEVQSYSFQYSLDGGDPWLPQSPDSPISVAHGGSFTIKDVPVLDLQSLNAEPPTQVPTEIMIRELVKSDSQHVRWELDGAALDPAYESDATFQYATTTFVAGPVELAETVPTPDKHVNVTNSYAEISVDKHIEGLFAPGSLNTTLLGTSQNEFDITYTVKNTGAVPLTEVSVYDSSLVDGPFTPQDITVDPDGRVNFPPIKSGLPVGESYTFTVTVTVPETFTRYDANEEEKEAQVVGTTIIGERTISATGEDTHGAMRLPDLAAMLPNTGATTLVWVLGLGLLVALAALANYIRSRRN